MPATDRKDSLPSGSQLHSYVVENVLGSGAFGITYLVRHSFLDSQHVIKEYLPDCGIREHNRSTVSPKSAGDKELFDWGFKCFFDEAKLLHQLSHPHIVKVSDLFVANSTAYFVMPYLLGITLHEWMKKHPSPSQSELEAIFVPLIEGLKYIHNKGLLHRDIKPENIYILENGHPILIDFGSARIAIGQKSKALTQVLTPGFAPIEQYSTKGRYTAALDLYSLAACMYMAITAEMPDEAPDRLDHDELAKLVGSKFESQYTTNFLRAIDIGLRIYARDRHQDGFEFQKYLTGYKSAADEKSQQEGLKEQNVQRPVASVNDDISGLSTQKLQQQRDIDDKRVKHKIIDLKFHAKRYVESGAYQAAKNVINEWLSLSPNDSEAKNLFKKIDRAERKIRFNDIKRQSQVLENKGFFEEAKKTMQKVSDSEYLPEANQNILRLGKLITAKIGLEHYISGKEWYNAKEKIEAMVGLSPANDYLTKQEKFIQRQIEDVHNLHYNNLQSNNRLPDDSKQSLQKFRAISFLTPVTNDSQSSSTWTDPFSGMDFIFVEAGEFMMGSNDKYSKKAEYPVHNVRISRGFYLGKYPVTQSQWEKVMCGSFWKKLFCNPSRFKGASNPVECVYWEDVQEFIVRLKNLSMSSGFRLPTEAEWEYAARGGMRSKGFKYAGSNNPDAVAWHERNSGGTTHPVGGKSPNELGLYDMSGNVWEWCQDWYNEDYYSVSPEVDPHGPSTGSSRVLRGGSWGEHAQDCRLANRDFYWPAYGSGSIGFRLALTPSQQ